MPFGVNAAYGARFLLDRYQNFLRSANPVYLRLRNFTPPTNQLYSQLGFTIAPSGTNQTGLYDTQILPPPSVTMVSVHNIGQSMGKLRFGARVFCISHSFVTQQKVLLNLTGTDDLVWRGPQTVGLVLDNQLFSIDDVQHEEAYGATVSWVLTCNSSESPVTTLG